jgi:hypothetical protein
MALDEFMEWFQQVPRNGFTNATVQAWRVSLEERGLGSSWTRVDIRQKENAVALPVYRAALAPFGWPVL